MAFSNTAAHAKMKLLERFFPEATEAQTETFEILMDIEQAGQILASLDDVRKGSILSMVEAFGDL